MQSTVYTRLQNLDPDYKIQGLQTVDYKSQPWTLDYRLQTMKLDYKLQAADCTVDYAGFRLQTTETVDYGPQTITTDYHHRV